ncbi:MAG TPA: hypothetical protein VLV86_08210 [Vicinamibacterales bacterium]|nr:hypothetical protein [Vicinamibacterales bacterium]
MLAAAAVIWITLDAEAAAPAVDLGRGWTLAAVGNAAWTPLFVYPDYQDGARLTGGFRFVHPVGHDAEFDWSGRTGATHVDDWRALFESFAAFKWRPPGLEIRAGLRHDDRLSREGPRVGFRDPTGRVALQADVLPLRKGAFAAGASVEYQRGLPGVLRLPSSASATVVGRFCWRPGS